MSCMSISSTMYSAKVDHRQLSYIDSLLNQILVVKPAVGSLGPGVRHSYNNLDPCFLYLTDIHSINNIRYLSFSYQQ